MRQPSSNEEGFLFCTGDLYPTCQPGRLAEVAKQEIVMTVHVQLLSAFIRKADIAAHYPGGCETFEQQHTLGEGDAYLYRLMSMSSEGLGALLDEIEQDGLDIEQFVAIADMWAGPFKEIPNISFTRIGEDFPPTWIAASTQEQHHD
jgi:hypothetical protein